MFCSQTIFLFPEVSFCISMSDPFHPAKVRGFGTFLGHPPLSLINVQVDNKTSQLTGSYGFEIMQKEIISVSTEHVKVMTILS